MPFSRSSKINETDQLDKAGQTILHLVERAAGVSGESTRHALDMVQNFRISSMRPKIGSQI